MSMIDPVVHSFHDMARQQPERVALRVAGDTRLDETTYRQLATLVATRRDLLQEAGLAPGMRVVLIGANSIEYVATYLALADLSATAVPLDAKLTDGQLSQLLGLVQPSLIVGDPAYAARVSGIVPDAPYLSFVDLSVLSGHAPLVPAPAAPGADPDIAVIIFTSGATALPKGAMLSRSNMAAALGSAVAGFKLDPTAEVLCVLPMFHVLGLGTCLSPLLAGGGVTFLEELRGDLLLATLGRTGTTILPGPPRLFELILTSIRTQIDKLSAPARFMVGAMRAAGRLSRTTTSLDPAPILFRSLHQRFGGKLHTLFSGGAALPAEVRQGLEDFGFFIMEGYGMTETAAGVSMNTREQLRAGSVGRALPGVEVRIANPDVHGQGELQVRGPTIMRGYLEAPELTAEVFAEGWLRTGDLARVDADGFIFITGRIKELIVSSSGKKVSPEEVEAHYQDVEGVADLTVLGMPSKGRHGEDVHAAIVLSSPGPEAEGRALAAVSARSAGVPSHQRVQQVHVVSEIPRTTTLKVRRSVLRTQLLTEEGAPGARRTAEAAGPALARDPRTQAVVAIVQEVVGRRIPVNPGSTIVFDLGLDSMAQLELGGRLAAHFGVRVDGTDVQTCLRVEDLAALVARAPAAAEQEPTTAAVSIPPPRAGLGLRAVMALRSLLGLTWGLRFEGLDKVPTSGAFILCPNHASHVDALLVIAGLEDGHKASLSLFSKREHFDHWLMRRVTAWMRAIPVDRTGDAFASLRTGAAYLQAGRPLLVHPEGTRTRDGQLLPFRRGAAHLALSARVPLVPVFIQGSYQLYPSHRLLPPLWWRKRPLVVRIGDPIPPHTQGSEAEQQLTELLRARIASMAAQ